MKLTDFTKSDLTSRLPLAAGGEDCWIEYKSTSCDEFIEAKNSFDQAFSRHVMNGKELVKTKVVLGQEITERSDDYKRLFAVMMASLITDWSLEDDLNLENAATLLYNNPAVCDALDTAATAMRRAELIAKKKPLNTPKESSDS